MSGLRQDERQTNRTAVVLDNTLGAMKNPTEHRRLAIVSLGFGAFIVASLIVGYYFSLVPSPSEACEQKCASAGKVGRLIYSGPATPKQVYKEANSECRCQ